VTNESMNQEEQRSKNMKKMRHSNSRQQGSWANMDDVNSSQNQRKTWTAKNRLKDEDKAKN
jgi:hypothetical protein